MGAVMRTFLRFVVRTDPDMLRALTTGGARWL